MTGIAPRYEIQGGILFLGALDEHSPSTKAATLRLRLLLNSARVAKVVANLVAWRPKTSPPGAVSFDLKRLAQWLRR